MSRVALLRELLFRYVEAPPPIRRNGVLLHHRDKIEALEAIKTFPPSLVAHEYTYFKDHALDDGVRPILRAKILRFLRKHRRLT